MLIARILTAVVLLGACIAALFLLPAFWWSAAARGLVLLAAWEWAALAGYGRASRALYCIVVLACAAALYRGIMVLPGGDVEAAVYLAGGAFWVVVAPAWLWFLWRPRGCLVMGAA